jgi:membrane protease YdiL (CAAX protease family)
MFRQPPFRDLSPYLKLLSLLLVVISTGFLVMAVSTGLAIPLFGKNVLNVISEAGDYSDPATITALKYFQVVNQLGIFVLPAILFVLLTDNDIPGYLKLRDGWHRMAILYGTILILVSLPLNHWLMEINGAERFPSFLAGVEDWMKTKEEEADVLTEAFLSTSSIGGFLFNLLMIAAIAAIGEELIFRGILVRLFHEWTSNIHLAVIIPALIFSALHLQFYGFLPRFLLGIFLGYLFIWTGSLKVPMLVHFINNAFAVIIAFMDGRGWIHADFERVGASGNPVIIACSVVMTVAVLWVIYYHEQRSKQRMAG